MIEHSALYVGSVQHRRYAPVPNEFRYPVYMAYLDLEELDAIDAALWPLLGTRRPGLAWFRQGDHLASEERAGEMLADRVRRVIAGASGRRVDGRIGLLTHTRHLGYAMNPVSFFYCWTPAGDGLEMVVAEVSNTPWDERHVYVVPASDGAHRSVRHTFPKAFHVSPFLPLGLEYDWRFSAPDERLAVHMICRDMGVAGQVKLDATLSLQRRPLDRRHLAECLARFPAMTATVVTRIYWQALRLWWRRTPFYAHPGRAA